MAKKNTKVPQQYKESPEARRARVAAEGNRFHQRVVESKKVYNRKKLKKEDNSYANY